MYYNFRDPYYAPSRGYRGLPKSHYRAYKDQLREDFKNVVDIPFAVMVGLEDLLASILII